MSDSSLVSVVVPIGSPDAHPRVVVESMAAALRRGGYTCEFVLVLDGPVGSVEREIETINAGCPVRIVRLQGGGLGESIALSAGVAKANGRFIVNIPPYLQTDADDILQVVAALEAGADCVATWRTPRVDPWLNQLQSRLFNRVLQMIMGMPFHDLNSGMRGFRKQVLEEVSVYGDLYRFLPVLALRQGFRVVEVKVRHREERGSAGFYGVGVYLRRTLDILAISFLTRFTQRPLRFFGYVGFLAIVFGLLLVAQPLYMKLFEHTSLADRPLFVIGAIMSAFGVQLIGFGLIGEIVIFTQAPNLRDYKIEEVVEGGSEPAPTHVDLLPAQSSGIANAVLKEEVLIGATPVDLLKPQPEAIADLPLRVREVLPGEDSRWDAFVSRHPLGTFFHLSGWGRVVRETYKHEQRYLVVEQGRRWLGVLPMFLTKSPFLGRNLISVPYGVYGGVLADTDAAQVALLAHAEMIGKENCVNGFVELRHLGVRAGDRSQSNLYVTFRTDLPEDEALVMAAIPKRARAEVRRARQPLDLTSTDPKKRKGYGIQMRSDCSVEELFLLFAENKRRLGSPALPRRWFQGLVDEFGKSVVIHRAIDVNGATLAAVMSFCFKDTVYAYYSGSLTGVNHTGVNNFIYCGIMEWAVRAGYSRFDFGRSREGSGPAHFKENMGFTAEPLRYEYMLLSAGSKLPQFHPGNPKLDLPRRIWSNLPMFLTNRLGARLSRYLP
ncbi:MAG: FemAB family PEP-CTERM system-associated protein [Planctomycetota bacterium]|nr:FemAB family PEP-CTERM system-associated protein [Planctomycetota bacterium]